MFDCTHRTCSKSGQLFRAVEAWDYKSFYLWPFTPHLYHCTDECRHQQASDVWIFGTRRPLEVINDLFNAQYCVFEDCFLQNEMDNVGYRNATARRHLKLQITTSLVALQHGDHLAIWQWQYLNNKQYWWLEKLQTKRLYSAIKEFQIQHQKECDTQKECNVTVPQSNTWLLT